MLNFFQSAAFGLDLSDRSLKIIKLKRKGRNFTLASYSRAEIPPGLIEKGQIKKEDELINLLKNAIIKPKGEKLKDNYCVVSLPETEAFIKIVQLPILKKQEIDEAIQWEAEAHIPLPIEEVYLDWQILGSSSHQNHYDILIGALSKKLVNPYLNALKKADLKPIVFEIESMATTRALIKENNSAQTPLMILDLGAERTNFIIFSEKTIHFTASLPVGNNQMTELLMKDLNVSPQKAQELKFKIGMDKTRHPKIYSALEKHFRPIIKKIHEYNTFYQTHFPAGHQAPLSIPKIILCGGGANLVGLPAYLTTELKIETKIGNPWVNILHPNFKNLPEISYKESITYATAIGLALRATDEDLK